MNQRLSQSNGINLATCFLTFLLREKDPVPEKLGSFQMKNKVQNPSNLK